MKDLECAVGSNWREEGCADEFFALLGKGMGYMRLELG
jgi:hypothetical protein